MKERELRRMSGLCIYCGERKALHGRIMCAECLTLHKGFSRERRERLRKEGICYECGHAKAVPGKGRCADCIERSTLRKIRSSYKAAKISGENEQMKFTGGGSCEKDEDSSR